MSDLLNDPSPLVPFIGAILFLAIGLAGIFVGRAACRELGPSALIRYPWPGLRFYLAPAMPARNVVRSGWVLVAMSPALPLIMNWDVVSPTARAHRANSACVKLLTPKELESTSGFALEQTSLSDDGTKCWVSYMRARKGRSLWVMTISVRPGTLPGGSYLGKTPLEQVAEQLPGEGHERTPLPTLGKTAFWERNGNKITIAFEAYGVPAEIEIDESATPPDLTDQVIDLLESRGDMLRPYMK